MSQSEAKTLMAALAAVFAPSEVKFKPGVVSGSRALALPYVDCRVIQDRLDDVLGIDGWQDQYTPLPDGSVVCELRCRIGGDWIVKTDVGSPSEQPDGGDRLKAAFSDALKRAAVKFGIGRYLYRLPSQWVDYDSQKRRFARTPELPRESTPAGKMNGQAPEQTITDDERQALTELLTRKNKTVKAAMKSAGSNANELGNLTREQYQLLVGKLEKLSDVRT
jgi:hypothetical protein